MAEGGGESALPRRIYYVDRGTRFDTHIIEGARRSPSGVEEDAYIVLPYTQAPATGRS